MAKTNLFLHTNTFTMLEKRKKTLFSFLFLIDGKRRMEVKKLDNWSLFLCCFFFWCILSGNIVCGSVVFFWDYCDKITTRNKIKKCK